MQHIDLRNIKINQIQIFLEAVNCGSFSGAAEALHVTQPMVSKTIQVKGVLLTEYNEVEAMELFKEDGRREGRAEGRAEGENRFALLMAKLLSLGKTKEAERAATDQSYRNELYIQYGIV